MADFRKCVFAFAALALLLGVAGTANAQTAAFQCVANASIPPIVRAEGITELVGDVVLNCQGGVPVPGVTAGGVVPTTVPATMPATVNIRVSLNTNVTSRLLTTSGNWSESLLVINEATSGLYGCQGTSLSAGTSNLCNVYQGRVVDNNAVEFVGVPVLPPGSTGTTIYRVTNIRANASALAAGSGLGQIIGTITATPATLGSSPSTGLISPSFPINNPSQNLGSVLNGLTFTVRTAANDDTLSTTFNFSQCVSRTSTGSSGFAVLRYTEGFPTAFRLRGDAGQNVLGFPYGTESGYYNPSAMAAGVNTQQFASAGFADAGTRVRAVFSNIPAGIRLFVTTGSLSTSVSNTAVLTQSEAGPLFPVPALSSQYGLAGTSLNVAEVPIVSGTGMAVWELTTIDPLTAGRVDFGLFAIYTSDVANNAPAAPSQATVAGSFAPVSTVTTAATALSPVPRFVDEGASRNLFNINVCVTNLLFPFVTNLSLFDTGLAIANTTQDPFGTATQAGTCTLNWYGSGAPAATTTPSVAAGSTWVNTVMNLAPGFQGYMIAQCRFQFAHGFAFISDIGARNLAMGYLALIIPEGRPAAGTGEALDQ